MINYKKTYKESTSWRHWRLSCSLLSQFIGEPSTQMTPNTFHFAGVAYMIKNRREIFLLFSLFLSSPSP